MSRLVDLVLDPANVIGAVIVAAGLLSLAVRTRAAALSLARLAALLVVAAVLLPVDVWLLHPLEQRFPVRPLPARVDGIIVLGGSQIPWLTSAYGQAALNERAERMTTFLALARRYPRARLVFAGARMRAQGKVVSEADTMRLFLREQGFDDGRVIYETESTNTWENVVNADKMIQPRPEEQWLVVASAADVPRTVAVFRRVGWKATPVPVDYRVVPEPDWRPALHLSSRFGRTYEGLHEWVGLIVYFLLDRSESLFPAP